MFNRNKKGGDGVRKSIQKLLDPKRDSDKRLSNLRHIIDNAQEIADQQVSFYFYFSLAHILFKLLFCQFYSHIFYVFYENFLLVEQKLKSQNSGKRALDDLNEIVWVLEEIIILLPDLVHERWQYNSILGNV